MKLALAYPYAKQTNYQCYQPLALLYVATPLKQQGVDVRVLDLDGFAGGPREMVDELVRFEPDLIGSPVFSDIMMMRHLRAMLTEFRARLPRATIIGGGAHATACPNETFDAFPQFDWVLRGEVEETFGELIRQLESNTAKPEVPGLCRRGNGRAHACTPPPPPLADLDALPIPDRGFLSDNYRRKVYYRLGRVPPADMIMTSRGCPYRCNFCFNVDKGYRARSPRKVVEELVYLRSLGITTIDFMDELFTASKKRCLEICRLIREAGLKLDLKIRSHVRSLDEELLNELKRIGVSVILFGVESGSDTVLRAMNKNASAADNERAIRLVKKAGLRCYVDILLGYPGETRQTIAETRRFVLRTRPTAIQLNVMTPYPETAAYRQGEEDGTLDGRWGADLDHPPFLRLPWAADPTPVWAEAERLRRTFFLHPLVLLGIARALFLRLDARQWLMGLRLGLHWLRLTRTARGKA